MERRSDGVADDASQQAVGQLVYRLDQAGINWPALLEAAAASGRGEGPVAAAAGGKPGAADGRGVGAALLGAMGGFLGQPAAGQQSGDALVSMEESYARRGEVMPSLMGSLDESDTQPDGATLCPVPWDAMTSEDKEGLSGAGPCAEDGAAAAVPAARQAAGPESSR